MALDLVVVLVGWLVGVGWGRVAWGSYGIYGYFIICSLYMDGIVLWFEKMWIKLITRCFDENYGLLFWKCCLFCWMLVCPRITTFNEKPI